MDGHYGLTATQFQSLLKAPGKDAARLLAECCEANSDASFVDLGGSIDAVLDEALAFVRTERAVLQQALCVDFDACQKRKALDGAAFHAALETALGPVVASWARNASLIVRMAPVSFLISVVAYALVTWGIDAYCDCA